jgi:hypothetical protein
MLTDCQLRVRILRPTLSCKGRRHLGPVHHARRLADRQPIGEFPPGPASPDWRGLLRKPEPSRWRPGWLARWLAELACCARDGTSGVSLGTATRQQLRRAGKPPRARLTSVNPARAAHGAAPLDAWLKRPGRCVASAFPPDTSNSRVPDPEAVRWELVVAPRRRCRCTERLSSGGTVGRRPG